MMATVLIMNASGKHSVQVNRDLDVIGKRKQARREIILETKASIVLIQESDINIDSFLPRTGRYPKFGCLGSKQAAILFRTQIFETSGCATLRREVGVLCNELEKTGILSTENEVMPRLCVAQLQMLSNDFKFLFISWSGQAYADIEKRKRVLKDMLTLVDMFMVGKPVYILIGGDFNMKYDTMKEVISEYQHFYLCECSKEDKYPNKTGFFIISQPMATMVGDVHVFESKPLLRYTYHVQAPDLKHVLCNDPLFLNLHI